MPHEHQSLVQAGRKQWFLWVKHSVRTFAKSGLGMFLSYMLSVGPWRCRLGTSIQRHIDRQLPVGLKGLHWLCGSHLSGSGFQQAMTLLLYPVYCNCKLWIKRHFLLVCVVSSTTKMEEGPHIQRPSTSYTVLHGYVCVWIYPPARAHCHASNLFSPFLALSMSR